MFYNIGGKIKGVIKVFFTIMTVISIISGIVVMVTIFEFGSVFAGLLAGGVVAGSGILFAWLVNLVGYGFGQLVENSDRIREKLERMEDGQSGTGTLFTSNTSYSNAPRPTNPAAATPRPANNTATAPRPSNVVYENTSYVTCPNCKESQPSGRSYCNICGAKMATVKPTVSRTEMYDTSNKNNPVAPKDNSNLICCPKCGELQPKDKNYCQICGEKIPTVLY